MKDHASLMQPVRVRMIACAQSGGVPAAPVLSHRSSLHVVLARVVGGGGSLALCVFCGAWLVNA